MDDCRNIDGFLPFQQSAAYAVAAQALGARITSHDLGCGTAMAIERGRFRTVFRGPVWSADVSAGDRRRALRRLARWAGVTLVTPEDAVAGFGLIPLVTPLHHAIWALGPGLRSGMAGKWRNRLLAAEAAGICIRRGGRATLDHLIAAEMEQRALRGYRALPVGFTRALPDASLRLWEWRQAGEIAAAMAFVVAGGCATYHLGWTSKVGRGAGVHAVMLTHAAEALRDEGVRWLDLGSIDSDAAPGLARFKLGTGAQMRRLGATLLVLP